MWSTAPPVHLPLLLVCYRIGLAQLPRRRDVLFKPRWSFSPPLASRRSYHQSIIIIFILRTRRLQLYLSKCTIVFTSCSHNILFSLNDSISRKSTKKETTPKHSEMFPAVASRFRFIITSFRQCSPHVSFFGVFHIMNFRVISILKGAVECAARSVC